ncbi:hypothetical protein KDD30_02070 [Photobacterium sp. GJ3]|uniref:hypothetical protein n=1 Tax=Photobacterium sp. GJ3 TaxID=2829502 RepID=UPI001B8C0536|nr:hypothetical protein [Photobacterium sp. GJ3]QUJ67962.1 hypothetical protein KDD30_02070 [Photobacterium sp. GJ3]
MDVLSNRFEKAWFMIFMALYVFIMMPFPWFYSESYLPGFLGIPWFVYGWLIHGSTVLLAIVVFAKQCLARDEYQKLPEYKQHHEG